MAPLFFLAWVAARTIGRARLLKKTRRTQAPRKKVARSGPRRSTQNSVGSKFSSDETTREKRKSPTRNEGHNRVPSREERRFRRHGRVTWLAASCEAAYSGGTAADFHGLPHCPCLQDICRCAKNRSAKRNASLSRAYKPSQFGQGWQCFSRYLFFQLGLRFSTSARRPSWESSRR